MGLADAPIWSTAHRHQVGVLDTDDGPAIIHAMRPARPHKFPPE